MKVAILYDGGSDEWSEADVAAVLANVREVRRSLRRHGHAVTLVPVYLYDLRWPARLQKADLVFNLCEGINGHARYEDWVLAALELTGVPFTGSRASAVTLSGEEPRWKEVLLDGRPRGQASANLSWA